jgi:Peptidase S46
MKTSRVLLLGFIVLLSTGLFAEEGMWMPQQIPALAAKLRALGFAGDPKSFADLTGQPMGAIVSLGGCTASFVSPDGLIVTNHHCVTGGLQFNSTPQRNLLTDGFFAPTLADEVSSGPGSRVFVTTSVVEATAEIVGGIDPKASDRERFDTIDRRVKARVAACEKDGSRCTVASFFEGRTYFEIKQLEIKDVRLVYAPAEGIGVFGGETDNWRWPRHTGDWSYLRAYVGKDGKPAAYDKANVPYRPKRWLKVAASGVKPDDLVFVVGYPGRTQRHQTYAEVKETVEWALPRSIRLSEEQLALIDTLTKENPALAIKLAGRVQGLNNGLTNSRGVLEGMAKGGALAKKQAREQELVAWIAASPARQEKYGQALSALQALQAQGESTRERNAALGLLPSASSYLAAAQTLYRLSLQRPKDDVARDPGFQERDWSRIREGQDRLQRTIDPAADRALLRWALDKAVALPAGQRIEPLDRLVGLKPGMDKATSGDAVEKYLDSLYAGTKLADRDVRLAYIDKSTAELTASGDTFIGLAAALEPLAEANREAAKTRAGAYARIRPIYMEALLDKAGGLLAPDANSTLRVTYGQVKGVSPRDGLFYKPQTTLQGIVEKHTGSGDFNAPQKQLDAITALRAGKTTVFFDKGVNDVPVNFLSTVDTTGGNSGSPTLNAKGELVGLLFDGTYESVSSDYLFDSVKTRSIHVDSRYMLWTMAEVNGAKRLLDEMGVSLAAPAAAKAPAKPPAPAKAPAVAR